MKKITAFTKTLLATSVAIATAQAHASIVRGDIDYQNFRDFAENKGQFTLDATNVEILDKQGQSVGTILPDIPMIDLAVVSRGNGVATLVEPQYLASVQHNRGYQSVQFGDHSSNNPDNHHFDYQITNRHLTAPGVEINSWHREDYHTPRLHKLVTEVAPIASSDETHLSGFTNKDKYTAFVRAGSGVQMVVDEQGGTPRQVAGAYNHMTGGQMLGSPSVYNHRAIPGQSQDVYLRFDGPNSLFNHPMGSSQRSGDSGSGVFAYDAQAGRWVYAASAQSSTGSNTFVISHLGLVDKNEQLSIAGDVISSGQTLAWTPNGNTSTLSTNGQTLLTVGLFDESLAERDGINNGHWFRPRQDHGKTFTVMGENNIIQLSDDINQGAGAIYFKGDTTVEGLKAGTTWLGAGVSIDKDKTVTWRVHNPTGDRLSKIGEGTLLVQGTGTNAGSISVGDGKVILDQQADSDGNKQAFSEVGIVSGRGTVVLNSKDQVNPDNIYFGFRGGRLDVNGNDLTFNRIQNADSGARIVNHNENQASNVSVKGFVAPKIEDIQLIPWERWSPTNSQTHLYEDRRYGYYILRGRWGTFIPGQPHENLSDENWEFVSKDKEEALALFNARRAERIKASGTNYHTGFNGVLGETDETRGANGELNIAYNPSLTGAKWLLTGGSNLNGTLSAENGTVLMSGRPTPHAYDFIGNKEVIIEGDWQNRNFKATTFEAKTDGKIAIGRNVDSVIGDFKGTGNGEIQAGFTQNKSDACLRSDRTGAVTCDTPTLSDKDLASWERTQIVGRVNLADQSRFTVGSKGHFIGTLFGTDDSTLALDKDAIWTMTGESGLNRLVVDNATVNLNANFEQGQSNRYNRLNIGELSGQGTFNYLTDIGQLESDRIMVGQASGDFKLNVKNTGAEPTHNDRLILLTAEQERDFKVALANPDERVDIGAYRYELIKGEQVYQLYSPKIEQEFLERERLEKERLEAEKLAKEKAEAERLAREKAEAERLEREKAEAERLEKERLETERLEAEKRAEAERLERERLEAEKLAKEKAEAERLERERLEKERLAKLEAERLEKERLEAEKLAKEKAEAERLAREKLEAEKRAEAERLEKERLEAEKLAKEKAEAERLAREKLEAEKRAEAERLERERLAKLEAERLEKERLAKLEAEKLEAEKLAKEQAEKERLEKERLEAEKLAREKLEAEKLAKEKAEAERLAREKAEAERLEREKAEQERLEKERLEKERLEAEKLAREKAEAERLEREKAEQERLEAEKRAEAERLEHERLEAEKLAKEKAEAERLAREKAEAERLEREKAEAERLEKERLEKERLEAEKLAREKAEAERLEREKAEQERLEKERLEKERLEAEKLAREKAEAERLEREKAEQERLEAEKRAEAERLEHERLEAEKLAKEKAEAERLAREKAEAERLEREKAEAERLEKERLETERLEAEKRAEAERLERERLEAEKLAKEKAEAERLERERLEKERLAKLEAERLEKERLEAEKLAKEKAEAERLERERLEKERLAKLEAERLEKERLEAEKLAKEKAEAERLAREKLEAEKRAEAERLERERLAKLEAERLEKERLAKLEAERLEAEKLAKEQAEKERLEKERLEAEKLAREKLEAEKLAKEKAEAERLAREKAEAERLEREKAEQERLEKERLEKERLEAEKLAREKAEAERLEREKAEQERLEAEKRAEAERLEHERLEAEKLAKEKAEAERLAREKAEAERLEREKAEAERLEKERLETERLEAEKRAEAERLERERLEAEKLAKEKAEAERLAREKAEAERLEREKAERERLEKERLAKERTQADYISRYTNAGLSEIAATADTLTQLNRNLTTHILAQNSPNIWLAGETGNNTHQSPQYRPFKKDDTLTQIGIKQSVDNSRGTLQLGLAHSYHSSRQAFADDIYNRQETKLVSAFAKQAFANNVFVSADMSAGVAVNALISQGQTIDFKRKIVGGGINVGKTLYAGGVAIEPSVGVRYDTMAGVDYKLNQADIHSDDVKMVSYRAGVKVSGEFGVANTKVKPFLASDWTNHPSTADLLVNQHRFEQTFDNTQSHQLGLEIDKQAWTIRVSATHSDGNQTDGRTSAGLSVGYRW